MGRPCRYSTEAERLEARRQQTRIHVRAYRQRRREQSQAHNLIPSCESTALISNAHRLFERTCFMAVSPISTDFWRHSHLSAIDLSFGVKAHVVDIFTAEEQSFPWNLAIEKEKELQVAREAANERIANTAVFAAAAIYVSCSRPNTYSRALALEALHYTLRIMQKSIKLASDSAMALSVSTANAALWGIELVESHRAQNSHHAWLSHTYGSFHILNAAGPAAYACHEGIMVFRNMEPRLLAMAFRDRKAYIDEKAFYGTLFAHGSMDPLSKLSFILARIPRDLQCIDVLRETIKDPLQLCSALSLFFARLIETRGALDLWLARDAPNHGKVAVERSSNLFKFVDNVAQCMQSRNVFDNDAAMWAMITHWHYRSKLLIEILALYDLMSALAWPGTVGPSNTIAALRSQLRNELSSCITNIVRSAETALSDQSPKTWWTAVFLVSIPIRSVLRFLQQDSEMMKKHKGEYEWGLAIAKRQRPVTSRFSVGEYAADAIVGKVDGLPCIA